MATTLRQIRLSEIASEIPSEMVKESSALASTDAGQIVEECGGRLLLVDGFHRTAGQVRWCQENEVTLTDRLVTVVVCDDADLIRQAAEPGPEQAEAIEAIYAQIEE